MATTRRGRRRAILISAGALLLVVLVAAGWVLVRGMLADGELQRARPLVDRVSAAIAAGDEPAATAAAGELVARARSAAELTGDPVWRAAELLPWAGDDLAAVRRLAAAVRDVADDAVAPLASAVAGTGLDAFRPSGGRLDLAAVAALRAPLDRAGTAVAAARAELADIHGGLAAPIADARDELDGMLAGAAATLDGADRAARLLPGMLGADGPREILLLFQNPAELRSLGGIPGAVALVHADDGAITLAAQTSATALGGFQPPVPGLPDDTRALWGDNAARYLHDVTFTPQFPVAAAVAREMWRERFGTAPDAVVAVDPVVLGYLLDATGPVALATGETLTAADAATTLLHDVYVDHPEPAAQDAVFAESARAVFTALADGRADPSRLLDALARGGAERRILIWSADPAAEAVLAGTSLAGGLPVSDAAHQAFGVYLNDQTGSKMDSYLDVGVTVGAVVCRNDGRPEYRIGVSLRNTAPADAATSLPSGVTGGGAFGTPAGVIATTVHVYSAPGSYNLGVTQSGRAAPYQPSSEAGYTLSKVVARLAPGESASWTFAFLGAEPGARTPVALVTPGVHPVPVEPVAVSCAPAAD